MTGGIHGVIFDADGTLLDSMGMWMNVSPEYLARRGHTLPLELQKKLYSMSLEEGAQFIHDKFSLTETPEEITAEILASVAAFYKDTVQLKPGVREYVEKLAGQGIPMIVASAGNKELMEAAFTRLGLMKHFKAIITCTEMNVNKAVPDIFNKAAGLLGTKPEETAVFEDSLVAVKTARQAGFIVAGVQDIFNGGDMPEIQENSSFVVSDFRLLTKRYVIVSAAPISGYSRIRQHLNPETDFYAFCDAGLNHQEKLGITPDLIIGDFDSHDRPQTDTETIQLPTAKDDTDTFYALKEGLRRGFTDFLFLGAIGNRFDHSMCNISALLFADSHKVKAALLDDFSEMQVVGKEPVTIPDSFPFFSLLAVDGTARKVRIRNAKFPLEDGTVTADYQYTVSNEVLPGKTAEVSVGDGRLLLVKDF